MLIVGYCFGIRSERRLCQEVNLNLAYRWFCRLGLEDKVPDHSTFSVNRHGRFRAARSSRRVSAAAWWPLRGCPTDAGASRHIWNLVLSANFSYSPSDFSIWSVGTGVTIPGVPR